MSYLYLLAGEDMELATEEVKGFLRSQRVEESVERRGRLAETGAEPSQLRRLALVHEVSRKLEEGALGDLQPEYRPSSSYRVRAVEVEGDHDTQEIQERLGEVLEAGQNEVDLENPEEVVTAYLLEDRYVLGERVLDIDRGLFEKRKNQERPFSSPVSLDPVLARVLVNLAGVQAGEHVLDPFCGTGGVLIEAGLCGVGVHGLDISGEMVEGARENLEEYGIIVHDIRQGDVADAASIFGQEFSAVITDLPYGKASRSENSPVDSFLEIAPELANKVVFMSDRSGIAELEPEHEVYVHSNLTRYIYVVDYSHI